MIKRFIKGTLKWSSLALLFVIMTTFVPATFGMYGLYWERWTTSILGNPLSPRFSWYKPLELTQGNFMAPLETGSTDIPQDVFEAASTYAEENNSNSLVIQHEGKIVFERYWNDTQSDSLFGLHSLTKTMNAIMMGHAIEDGYVESVDTAASVYIEEWRGTPKEEIKIRDLLNMAGGLKEDYDFSPTSQRIQRVMGLDIATANINIGVDVPPGTVFSHVNPNSQML